MDDFIKRNLLEKGWPEKEITNAFSYLNKKPGTKGVQENKKDVRNSSSKQKEKNDKK